ncbi:MAG: hypothetical protein HZT43_19615 [Exiguobacterium profundum]|nr:MAG: hypothetical protein HZT43_19615 [Exiguobacterium profundum]
MKVGIFGNCQAQSVAACVSVLAPECDVHHCSVNRALAANEDERRAHIDAFSKCDYLLFQPSAKNDCAGFQATDLEAYCRNIVRLPLITSFSFHPDCHYLQGDSGKSLEEFLGHTTRRLQQAPSR